MESPTRSIAKATTWQILGLTVMTVLGYIHTGSIAAAASIAGSSTLLGFFSFLIHERLWSRVRWGTQANVDRV